MNKHSKFLEFNGKPILFVTIEGKVWISLPSLCKALNVDANRSYKNAKKDGIIGPALAIQPVQVSENGHSQIRNVTCIPEYLVYGWIFSVKSESEDLLEYKRTCYELLYNHFHGQIGNRKELLLKRRDLQAQIHKKRQELKKSYEEYKELSELVNARKRVSEELNALDSDVINQTTIFDN